MDSQASNIMCNPSPTVVTAESFVPNCADELKPYIGKKFSTIAEAADFYKVYGEACGFDIRMGSLKKSLDKTTVTWRYIYCNREGVKNTSNDLVELADGLDLVERKRRRVSMRCSCLARLVLKFIGAEGYIVYLFTEAHNHNLYDGSYKLFLKANRKVGYMHQKFFLDCHRSNLGPMKSYKLMKEIVGSYAHVGCSGVDVKNMARDLRAFVVGVDAQMLLDQFYQKRKLCSAFYFEYAVDAEDRLSRLFWCDPIARRNYHVFGDAVSFDATYSTNKYNMIFAPFTGKDNHGKLVTFGAGLLNREDVESYVWILEKFKDCMVDSPRMIITDQDPALKIAVSRVLQDTRHRFCIWHIMQKISDKMLPSFDYDDQFLKKFSCIVWSERLDKGSFEDQWNGLMKEYGLVNESWFQCMFKLREQWIPAFFRDFSMSGLARTTSISESVNSFFGKFTSKHANLVEFLMHFNNAMEAQRHRNAHLNCVDEYQRSYFRTSLAIEKHAASVYTLKIFRDVQKEILSACFSCSVLNILRGEEIHEYQIVDHNKNVCIVIYNLVEETVSCDCKMFVRVGLICCHMFFLFKNLNMTEIPKKYIVVRWTRQALLNPIHSHDDLAGKEFIGVDKNKVLMSGLVSEFYKAVGLVDGDTEQMSKLLSDIKDLRNKYHRGGGSSSSLVNKESLYEKFLGSSLPSEVSVKPPNPVKTKGSGSRLKSRKEKAALNAKKAKRKCSKCKKMTNHDARNCGKVANNDIDSE